MKTIDVVIEENWKQTIKIAKENRLDSHRTIMASQHLDHLLNIKMNEENSFSQDK
jgi:hypothetical protein